MIPRFATAVCALAQPALAGRPFAVAEGSSHRSIIAANERARGVCAGMTAKQACCACPDLTVVTHDEAAERKASHALLDALESCSPQVEGAEPGTYFFSARGLPRGERDALAAASDLASALGFAAHTAVADDRFTARCAALTRGSCSIAPAQGSYIVPAGGSAGFLAPLPMTVLPLAAGDGQRFELLGLRTLGQIAALPQAPLAARFGERARVYAALAAGKDETPLRPRHAVTVHEDRFAFDGAVVMLEPLLFALRGCITNVAARLAGAAQVCDRVTIQLLFDAPSGAAEGGAQRGDAGLHIPVSLAEPTACASTMFELARIALESRNDLRPVEAVVVHAVPAGEPAPQPALFERSGRSQRAALAATLARLHAALDPADVVTVQPQLAASRLPERMQRATPIDSPRQFERQPNNNKNKKKKKKAEADAGSPFDARSVGGAVAARGAAALRLLVPPQPMPAPDEHARRAGPFRLSESWWERPADRDYYQMVDPSGALVLAFRDVRDDRWYVQGVFD
ncbi:MAG: hypothetical protein ACR2KS_08220 [Candidatus Eremiobacter antarcticus]|nr:hypothetical protein [Candidatus Eremiobacteraeota bacterium]MBC5809147.1 hypothetical protein [Candidatus Eremiobacteraeota bacterium]